MAAGVPGDDLAVRAGDDHHVPLGPGHLGSVLVAKGRGAVAEREVLGPIRVGRCDRVPVDGDRAVGVLRLRGQAASVVGGVVTARQGPGHRAVGAVVRHRIVGAHHHVRHVGRVGGELAIGLDQGEEPPVRGIAGQEVVGQRSPPGVGPCFPAGGDAVGKVHRSQGSGGGELHARPVRVEPGDGTVGVMHLGRRAPRIIQRVFTRGGHGAGHAAVCPVVRGGFRGGHHEGFVARVGGDLPAHCGPR